MQVPSSCLTSLVPPSDGWVAPRTRDLLTPAHCESAAEGAAARQVSAGGLVSALMGVSNFKTCWVGWPGAAPRHGGA